MLPLQPFEIRLNGLTSGISEFHWAADKSLFEFFDNDEVLQAALEIDVEVEKSGSFIGVDCDIDGELTVPCDRCLEDLKLPVSASFSLSVKFGDEEGAADSGDREILMVPYGAPSIDLRQTIYDCVCVSLPMQRVHSEGECNGETVGFLSK